MVSRRALTGRALGPILIKNQGGDFSLIACASAHFGLQPFPCRATARTGMSAAHPDDLHFPIADGDVIHIFDRDGQKYVLHLYEGGKWTSGPPILSVGESFWVAKTEPGNWIRNFVVEP